MILKDVEGVDLDAPNLKELIEKLPEVKALPTEEASKLKSELSRTRILLTDERLKSVKLELEVKGLKHEAERRELDRRQT